jgi:hypothetical protein
MEDNVGVSYGYFFNPIQLLQEDGTIRTTTSLNISGVTPIVLGEGLLSLLPSSADEQPTINFSIAPGSTRTITRYFVVGDGDVASVLDTGFQALGVSKIRLSGKVIDATGQPVARARVAALDGSSTATEAFSDASGNFSMDVSAGTDVKDLLFGSGTYTIQVYKEGFSLAGSDRAGKCSTGTLNAEEKTVSGIQCQLGATGTVSVTAKEGGQTIPARVTIVGFEPSPIHSPGADPGNFGRFTDINLLERPYGIVDLLYLDPNGNLAPYAHQRIVQGNQFRLEPGTYEIFVTHGPEYSVFRQRVSVSPGGTVSVNANLNKVLDTGGYVSADLHLHGIKSPDSAFSLESRVLGALAEGMDVLVSTDHDYVADYAPVIQKLGVGGSITSMAGDEITPLAFGHMLAFPLVPDPNHPTGGAYDYTYTPADNTPGTEHDLVQTLAEIIQGVDAAYPGTQVFQMAHILDKATGNFAISGLVTSPTFDGVTPLSTYADPVNFRMPANTHSSGGFQAPFPLGTSGLFSLDFTSMELTIGAYQDTLDHLMETSLPVYFNMLNLGVSKTATASSDSHTQVREPIGTPRNYIRSSIDPRDGEGSFAGIDPEEIATNVNAHRVVVSNGVFINARLSGNSQIVGVGDTLTGSGNVTLDLEVTSNEYFDWDRVEIYANTTPIPAKDDMSGVTDLSSAEFHAVTGNHTQKYLMTPLFQFAKGITGEGALQQTVANGVRRAVMSRSFQFSEDTWIVVLVRGSNGVRSLFPYVTKGANVNIPADNFLNTLDSSPLQIGGIRAFGFTNPIFVDVDGNGFEAKWVREGKSPIEAP